MDDLEIGDVVRLKSGGPEMTVNSVIKKGKATCVWFAQGVTEMQKEYFKTEAIEKTLTNEDLSPQPDDRRDEVIQEIRDLVQNKADILPSQQLTLTDLCSAIQGVLRRYDDVHS